MKYITLTSLYLLLLLCSCNGGQNVKDVEDVKVYKELPSKKYNAVALNNQVSSIQKGAVQVVESVFQSDTLTVDQKLDDAIFDLDISVSRLKSLSDEHEMAHYFSHSVINLINFYRGEFDGDFKNVVSILKKLDLSESDKIYLNEYDQDFANKEAVFFQEILLRQDSFANYFEIGLTN